MQTFIAVLVIFCVAFAGMAVGVIFSNRRLQGSCGGLGRLFGRDGQSACDACRVPSTECRFSRGSSATSESDAAENAPLSEGH